MYVSVSEGVWAAWRTKREREKFALEFIKNVLPTQQFPSETFARVRGSIQLNGYASSSSASRLLSHTSSIWASVLSSDFVELLLYGWLFIKHIIIIREHRFAFGAVRSRVDIVSRLGWPGSDFSRTR